MSSQVRVPIVLAFTVAVLALGAMAADKAFRAKTADRYPTRQKQGELIVAVKPFVTEKDQRSAFGKVRPYQYGVTPLLLVLSNTGTATYSLEKMQVRLITEGREGLEPVSGEDLATFNPRGHQPTRRTVPGVPGLSRTRVRKGPLNRPVVVQGEFLVPIVTPKSTASGFLYFHTGTEEPLDRASAYISGVYDITNGRDLFYFEIPLAKGR